MKEEKTILEMFLEKEGIKEIFVNNTNSLDAQNDGGWKTYNEENGNEITAVTSAFFWDMTDEEHDFWKKLDMKFINFHKNFKK